MIENKPVGMKIGESIFCGGYLLFVLVAGMVFVNGNKQWALIRNIPFLIVGLISVVNMVGYYICNGSPNLYLAVLIILSFVFYMIVVLHAKTKPMLGMLMIPKTICYILVICVFL
jgi:hypothetical protein